MPCPYANVLGSPAKGFHAHLFGVAINDIVGTVGLAYLTSLYGFEFKKALLGWFLMAEVAHYSVGVDTAVLRFVKLSPKCLANK